MTNAARKSPLQARVEWENKAGVPARQPAREPAREPAPKPVPRPENLRQKVLIRIGILIPLLFLVITLARGAPGKKAVPDQLLGVWQSSSARYAGCFMEIGPGTIQFGNAQKGYLLYFFSSVEQIPEEGQITYLIHYSDLDGGKYQMRLRYRPRPWDTLSFRSQPGVLWTRRPPG